VCVAVGMGLVLCVSMGMSVAVVARLGRAQGQVAERLIAPVMIEVAGSDR